MDQWFCGIEKANNGYIIRYNGEPDEDGDVFEEVIVLQEKTNPLGHPPTESTVEESSDLAAIESFSGLIAFLHEHFAVPHGKNSKHYLQIRIMKRHYDGGADTPLGDDNGK